jgi:hypothetical protein
LERRIDYQHDFPAELMCLKKADGLKLPAAPLFVQSEAFAKVSGFAGPGFPHEDAHDRVGYLSG